MHYICPCCNKLEEYDICCVSCAHIMQDHGKVTDYLDDYSAYEDITTLKLVDGLPHSVERNECLHIFYCPDCHSNKVVVISEKPEH